MKRLLVLVTLLFSVSFFNILGIRPQLLPQHFIFFFLSLAAFFLVRRAGFRFFYENTHVWYAVFIGLLVVTYVIGFEARGSRRWIDFGLFNFQPSEFFKVFYALYFAKFLTDNARILDEWPVIIKMTLFAAIPVVIVFLQPDLGSSLVYLVMFTTLILLSATPRRLIWRMYAPAALLAPLGWFFLKDYQRARLVSFMDPAADMLGSGYNVLQAKITAGSGGFFGKGLGYGTQTKLFFLPENHTDFAYASLVEQFGFIGGAIIICVYALLFIHLLRRALEWGRATDKVAHTKSLFGIAFVAAIAFQAVINIGMNLGIFPVTGITLPFISYGGSSFLSLFVGLALLL